MLVTKIMDSDKCMMEKIIDIWRSHPADKILDSGNIIMKTFQNDIKNRFRIAPEIVDKFREDICIMMDRDKIFIEVVEPRVIFIDPLGDKIIDNVAVSYIDLLLNSKLDKEAYRLGTCEEITLSTQQAYLEMAT